MNYIDPKVIAAFVSQRIEMGETEWYVNHEQLVSNVLKNNAEIELFTVNSAIQQYPSTSNESSCTVPMFSEEDISAQDSLGELHNKVCGCLRCPLGSTRTNFVFGDGNPDADIMFIGEAPGSEEDRLGKAFVGRAGKLLTKMIEAIKLSRADVFIGNILKCRPPKNRDPKPLEIEACEPILLRQIEIIKPKIICALGRISGQTLLRTKSTLGALRGKIHDYHGVKLIVTYHPAALLRNPKWKRSTWEDLKLLRREYDGVEL